jgi:hypothetical protein
VRGRKLEDSELNVTDHSVALICPSSRIYVGFHEVIYEREANQDKFFRINIGNLGPTDVEQILKYHGAQTTTTVCS